MLRSQGGKDPGVLPAPRVLSTQKIVLALLVFFALLSALYPAGSFAQTETNTTAVNETTTTIVSVVVKIVNVSVTQPPLLNIQPRFVNSSTVEVAVQCLNPLGGACPPLELVVGYKGAIYFNQTINTTCSSAQCIKYIYIGVNSTRVWLYYRYTELGETYAQNITLTYFQSAYPQYVTYIILMIPFALVAALMVRGNPVLAGLGGIAAGVGIYILGEMGYIPFNLTLANIAILVGALLLYLSGR